MERHLAMETAAPAALVKEPGTARLIGASVIGLLALLLISAGTAGIWARTASSDHGWLTSNSHRYAAGGNAIVSGSLDVDGVPDWLVAKVRVSATSAERQPVFVGLARADGGG